MVAFLYHFQIIEIRNWIRKYLKKGVLPAKEVGINIRPVVCKQEDITKESVTKKDRLYVKHFENIEKSKLINFALLGDTKHNQLSI